MYFIAPSLRYRADSRSTSLARQLGQPSLEKSPLRFLLGETQGLFVGGSSRRRAPESPAEIRPCRVRQVIVPEITAREDGVDEGKSRQRAVAHGHRRSAIQLYHGRWIGLQQQGIESDDLGPVRGGGTGCLRMHRGDRRLDGVWAEPARRQRPFHQRHTFRDLIPVPERAVLFVQ